jgi:hypothetical protein
VYAIRKDYKSRLLILVALQTRVSIVPFLVPTNNGAVFHNRGHGPSFHKGDSKTNRPGPEESGLDA